MASPDGGGLVATGLSKRYGGVVALDDVSFEVPAGVSLGIAGPNGAGKSTLIDVLSGHQVPDAGQITLDGQPIGGRAAPAISRSGIARTFQDFRLFWDLTVRENCLVAACSRHPIGEAHEKVGEALARVELDDKGERLASQLSTGERKRLEIARALCCDPAVLCLDEPTAGVDPRRRGELVKLVQSLRSHVTMVVVEHNFGVLRACCDELVVMANATVLRQGAPDAVLAEAEVVELFSGARTRAAS